MILKLKQINNPADSCRIVFSRTAGLPLILPRNVCTMLFTRHKKRAVDVERNSKKVIQHGSTARSLLSLSCRVISAYFLMNLTAAVEACGRLKETLLFRLFSSSFTQTDTQEADGCLHTAPYFLNSSVTDGLSGTAKRAPITSDTLAGSSKPYSHTNHTRQQICSA